MENILENINNTVVPEMNWATCNDDEQNALEAENQQLSEKAVAKFQSTLTDTLNEFLIKADAGT